MSWFGDLTLRIFPRLAANGPFNNHSTLTNGLVSYWKLDELSGVRYDSITTTGNDLTDNNTVTYRTAGPAGVVAQFTSANTENLSGTPGFNWAGATTTAFWFQDDNLTAYHDILNSGAAAGSFRCYSTITSGAIQISVGSNALTPVHTDTAAGAWHFVVATHDGAGGCTASVNNGTVTSVSGAQNVNGNGTLRIGVYSDGGSNPHQGKIARVGQWSRVLSAAEITSIYNTGSGKAYADLTAGEKTGLVSFWNLDEVSGTRADSHGSNTLTDNNTVTAVQNAVPPPKGTAAYFTGANAEYLRRADNSSLRTGTGNFTWSCWVRFTALPVSTSSCMISKGPQAEYSLDVLTAGGPGTFRFYTMNGGSYPVASGISGQVVIDTWYFVIGWRDSADNKNHISVNGVEGTPSSSFTIVSDDAAGAMLFGTFNASVPTSLTGALDEVGFWKRLLTTQERADLWNSGRGLYYGDTGLDTTTYYLLLESGDNILLEDGVSFLLKN